MGLCCVLEGVGPITCIANDAAGRKLYRRQLGQWLFLPDEAEDALDVVTKPYGVSGFEWLCRIGELIGGSGQAPWALIALDREYELVGHLMHAKGASRDLWFTWYSFTHRNPVCALPNRLSFLLAMNKHVLSIVGRSSPLIAVAWTALKDKSEDSRWFCLLDPLSAEWVQDAERQDSEIRAQLLRSGISAKPAF